MKTIIVDSLPGTKEPNTMYLVKRGDTFDIHISDNSSVTRKLEVGSVDSNSESNNIVFLTKSEYDELSSKDTSTLYVIKPA